MKIVLLLLSFSLVLMSDIKTINVGLLNTNVKNISYLELVVKVIEKNFNNRHQNIHIKTFIYRNKNKILKDFEKEKIQVLLSHPFFYYENKVKIDTLHNAKWLTSINNEQADQYFLVSKIKTLDTINDFSNYTLYSIEGLVNSRIWFKYFYNNYIPTPKNINNIKSVLVFKENNIINNVFFKEKSLGLVTKTAYDLLIELNPQLKKQVHILAKSKKIFISFIVFTHKSLSSKTQNILSSVSNAFDNVLGSSKMSSDIGYSLHKLENNSIINKFEDFYKEYQTLPKDKYP